MAETAGVSHDVVTRFEGMDDPNKEAPAPRAASIEKMRVALEKGGVEFIPENGGGAGVRLRKRSRSLNRKGE